MSLASHEEIGRVGRVGGEDVTETLRGKPLRGIEAIAS